MSAIPTVFEGEVQLLRWSETSNQGATITLQLSNPDDLERFKVMTLAKGKQAGQRLMAAMVEVGDDEQPVTQPKPGITCSKGPSEPVLSAAKEKPGPLCVMACNFCADPMFWQWIEDGETFPVNSADDAKEFIFRICRIQSRKELDQNSFAESVFHAEIRKPFMAWRDAR